MDSIFNCKIRRLNYLISEINSLYHEAAFKLGLSDSAMTVLYGIQGSGGSCPLSDIYKLSGISRQTVNSALRKLESKGVIYLENHGGKAKTVFLTESGREAAEKTVAKLIRVENGILDSWSEQEADAFLELNRKYAADLREKLAEIHLEENGGDYK